MSGDQYNIGVFTITQEKINSFIDLFFKSYGLVAYLIILPIVCHITAPIFTIPFLTPSSENIQMYANIVGGAFLGLFLFIHTSMFDSKFDKIGMLKIGRFNPKKFIFSIFLFPIMFGELSHLINFDVSFSLIFDLYNDLNIMLREFSSSTFANEHPLLLFYLQLLLPMIPGMLTFYLLIKIGIYWFFIGSWNLFISYFELLFLF